MEPLRTDLALRNDLVSGCTVGRDPLVNANVAGAGFKPDAGTTAMDASAKMMAVVLAVGHHLLI